MDLSRVEIVIGKNSLEKLRAASVAVVGLGGVGSYVAEAMTRSGVGKLLLVDFDSIASSNVNRQIPALDSTIGLSKTEVLKKRLLEINRDVRIEIYNSRYNPGDFKKVFTEQYSYIVDAIDAVDAKADLIFQAVNNKIPLISAMGTGNKLDPALLRVADISATHTCPLARAVRSKLRQKGLVRGVKVVFSLEKPQKAQLSDVPGSLIFVPASAGLLMGSVIVREIIDND